MKRYMDGWIKYMYGCSNVKDSCINQTQINGNRLRNLIFWYKNLIVVESMVGKSDFYLVVMRRK